MNNAEDTGARDDKPPSRLVKLAERDRVAKVQIIALILDRTDTCSRCGSMGVLIERSEYGDKYECPTCKNSWIYDTNPERHTLTKLFAVLKDHGIPRSTLHKYLKQLVEQRWLAEESDEIKAMNNQPMKIVRYVVDPSHAEMVRQMIADRYVKNESRNVL